MIATIQLKKRITNTCVFGIIISEPGYWYEPGPIILLEIDKALEVGFHSILLFFGLTVSLQIKGGKKPTLDTKKVTEQLPEFQDE